MVLRRLRLDHHRLCAASDHRLVASQSAADRSADRNRFRRPVGGRHRIRLACRALGPPALHVDYAAHLLTWRLGLRRRDELRGAVVVAFRSGHWPGRRIPLMAAYLNEFVRAENRGRFSLSVQVLFSIGLLIVALVSVYVVPHWGWRWMFVIGAIPALVGIPMRTVLPESPRWLASQGRNEEADRALTRIEDTAAQDGKLVPPLPKDLPEVPEARPRIVELFRGIYLRRTISVWFIWIGAYFVSYGITAWVPSLFRTVYHLDVEQSLIYGLIISSVGLCGTIVAIYLIDVIGRRPLLILSLGGCCVPLISFAFLPQLTAAATLAVATTGFFFLSLSLISLATYTAEIYPTHLRALGGRRRQRMAAGRI